MGVSIAISLRSQLRSSTKRKYVFGRIVRRSIALLIMGLVLNSVNNNNLSTFRPLGVLQRLALVYFIAATLETIFMKPQPYFTVIFLKFLFTRKFKNIYFNIFF
jgi:heparan-alpha-glucosaminide N-acetyltransferase